ncbi:MAG: hypothetical protein ABJE95_28845 [Byssovorax sp.]
MALPTSQCCRQRFARRQTGEAFGGRAGAVRADHDGAEQRLPGLAPQQRLVELTEAQAVLALPDAVLRPYAPSSSLLASAWSVVSVASISRNSSTFGSGARL